MSRFFVAVPILLIAAIALLAIATSFSAGITQVDVPSVSLSDTDASVLAADGTGYLDIDDNHAWMAHDAEALRALSCLENKGPQVTFRERNKGPVHFLCMDDNGTWYDVIVDMLKKGRMKLKTAFSPKGGDSNAIYQWLLDKGATKWNGGPSSIEFNWLINKPY